MQAGSRDHGELMQRQDLGHVWGNVLQKTSSRRKHIPGKFQNGVASEGVTNRDTSRQCQQHEATPELNNQVSNDTMPKNVLILHDSALYRTTRTSFPSLLQLCTTHIGAIVLHRCSLR